MTKIHFITHGCSTNQSDSEVMAGILAKHDFKIVNKTEDADLIVFNTCAVKKQTETNFYKKLEKLKELNKPIIIAGCIPQTTHKNLDNFSLIGTDNLNSICEVIEETLQGNIVKLISNEKNERLNLPKIRKNKFIEIIPINKGCLGSCNYCIVKQARGNLISYDKKSILIQAKNAIMEGVKEIWLTSQDTGCYGKDIKENLPSLLDSVSKLPGQFMIRVGMMNPNNIYDFLDSLIEAFKNEKVFKFLHLPVQSANNGILKSMNRSYKIHEFENIIKKFRKEIPAITIATDIIVGYPYETDEQFNDSLNLVRELKPDVLNISKFGRRPGTKAFNLEEMPGAIVKNRSRILTFFFLEAAAENNKKWMNWEGNIIIDEIGKNSTYVGRNFAYKPVIVQSNKNILGEIVKVKIISTTTHDLRGSIIL